MKKFLRVLLYFLLVLFVFLLPFSVNYDENTFDKLIENTFPVIKEEVEKGKPLLGICLGMQLLFEKGFEGLERKGLGLLQGSIVKMKDDKENNVKIPHIGWNNLSYNQKDELFNNIDEGNFVYFVHSYYAQGYRNEDLVAYCEYGNLKIPGVVRHKNVMGAQFHPEKSGTVGLNILRNFGELIK